MQKKRLESVYVNLA